MAEFGVFEEMFRALDKNPASRWIFGERFTLGGKDVVPVSEFRLVAEMPGGVGAAEGTPAPASLRMEGRPIGFLAEHDGAISFVSIPAGAEQGETPDRAPRWADDLFRRLDDVRAACTRRDRGDDERYERGERDRPWRDSDEDVRGRRPRRDRDDCCRD